MGLLEELRASTELKAWHNGGLGSFLDQSGNGITLSVGAGSGNAWRKVRGRLGYGGTAASELTGGVQASLDLSVATLFYAATFLPTGGAYLIHAINKYNGVSTGYATYLTAGTYNILLGSAAGNQSFGVGTIVPNLPTLVAHAWNGVNITTWINGIQVDLRAQTKVSNSVGQTYRFGWPAATSGLHQVSIGMGGMINRVLTGSEVARLYDEWMMSGPSVDLPRRNLVQVPKGLTDAEYAAKNIALDTAFETGIAGGARKVLDMGPNNYAGTITGVAIPGQDGFGLQYPGAASNVYFGDVTQLNSAAAFTLEHEVSWPTGNIVSNFLLTKYTDANNNIDIEPFGAAATTKKLYFAVCNAGATYGTTNSTVFRAGCVQHYMTVFNGLGADNAAKSQVYVDGELYPQTYVGNLPAATANLATKVLYAGYTGAASAIVQHNKMRASNVALTAAQARARYVEFARRVLLHETFEDVQVSLAAVSAGNMLGKWRVIDGGAQCVEDSVGRRSILTSQLAQAGVALPYNAAFGTWRFRFSSKNVSQQSTVQFISSVPGAYGVAGQTGYSFYCAGQFYLLKSGPTTFLATVGLGVVTPQNNVEYDVCITRRPSDCQFKMYLKGGTLTAWALVATATDTSHLSCSWINFSSGSINTTAAMPLYDPRDPTVGLIHYQGQLDPTAGELF